MIDNSVERISICKVLIQDDADKPWLIRLADIDNGILRAFHQIDGTPKLFDNRDRLFWRDGPDEDGILGIWKWSAIPNINNPATDYIETRYVESLKAIEIVEITAARTIEDILKCINHGLEISPVSDNILLCPKVRTSGASNKYDGLLCTRADMVLNNDYLFLKDSVISLPQYSFMRNDIIYIDGKKLYCKLDYGDPVGRILVKEPSEIVRDAVVRRGSWSAAKTLGITKNTWQSIREFITGMPTDSLYSEIATACQCDEEEAKDYVDKFLAKADQYINHEDVDSSVMLAVLETHPELLKKCEDLASERWQKEHNEGIEKANLALNAITSELERKADELNARISDISLAEGKLDEIKKDIQTQEQLAEDVSKKVQNRILDARKDAASFIAEMAFVEQKNVGKIDNKPEAVNAYFPGSVFDSDGADINSDWEGEINTLYYELMEAGVAEKYANGFAAFLYAAYANHFPILLVGPNGESIANAFAISLFGRTAGIVDGSAPYPTDIEKVISESNDPVFVIKHAFRNEWITHLPDFQTLTAYHFIIHPFVEDLVIEPKSLFSYVFPVFTDLIIDSLPKGDYVGAKRSESFNEYKRQTPRTVYNKLLKTVGFSPYARTRVQAVITDFHALMKPVSLDLDCLFSIFPYAFITDRHQVPLLEKLSGSIDISNELMNELAAFLGVEDE